MFAYASMCACFLFLHCVIMCISRKDRSALCFMSHVAFTHGLSDVSLALYGEQIFAVEGTTHPSVYLSESCENQSAPVQPKHSHKPNAWFCLYAMPISSFLTPRTLFSFFSVSLMPSLAVFLGVMFVCRKRLLLFNL